MNVMKPTGQTGFTLVELMVAMGLSTFMLLGAFQIFDANFRAYGMLVSDSHIQESGRIARSIMVKDIQISKSLGCRVKNQGYYNLEKFYGSDIHPQFDLDTFEGFTLADNVSANKSIVELTSVHTSGDATKVETGTDVLTLSKAKGLTNLITLQDANVLTMTGSSFRTGEYIMLKSCTKTVQSEIFQIIAVADGANTQALTLDNAVEGEYVKNGLQLMSTSIYKLEAVSYFVSDSVSSTADDKQLSLFRKVNNRAAVEFIAGVDDLQIAYETSDGTTSSYSFVGTANQVVNAGTVDVHLVLRSDNTNSSAPFTGPVFGKNAGGTYTDGKLRRMITFSGKVRS